MHEEPFFEYFREHDGRMIKRYCQIGCPNNLVDVSMCAKCNRTK